MVVVTRKFTYRGRIKVSPGDLRLAREGNKTCTIRLGTIGVQGDQIDLSDGRDALRVRVTSVETDKRFSDLSEEHAHREGFPSIGELRADLQQYYGNVDPAQPITIINFNVIKPT